MSQDGRYRFDVTFAFYQSRGERVAQSVKCDKGKFQIEKNAPQCFVYVSVVRPLVGTSHNIREQLGVALLPQSAQRAV